jgi:hypothetical protein
MKRWSVSLMPLQGERTTSHETTPLSGAFLEMSFPFPLGTGVLGVRLAPRCGERLW